MTHIYEYFTQNKYIEQFIVQPSKMNNVIKYINKIQKTNKPQKMYGFNPIRLLDYHDNISLIEFVNISDKYFYMFFKLI